jgi:hypothetical protein
MTGLTFLNLSNNYALTGFTGSNLISLETLIITSTQLTSFDGTGLSSLTYLDLPNNPLISFNGGDMEIITSLDFQAWGITTLETFDGGNVVI